MTQSCKLNAQDAQTYHLQAQILNCPLNTSLEMSEFWTFPLSLLYSSSAPSQLMAPWSLPGAHAKSLSTILDSSFFKKKNN